MTTIRALVVLIGAFLSACRQFGAVGSGEPRDVVPTAKIDTTSTAGRKLDSQRPPWDSDLPTSGLGTSVSASHRDPKIDPHGKGWMFWCQTRFEAALGVLPSWGYATLVGGDLRIGLNSGGVAVVSYNLERPLGQRYLVEVTGEQPFALPDHDWLDQNGQPVRTAMAQGRDPWPAGRIAIRKDFGGHASRIVLVDEDIVRRHNFAAAFMPIVDDCVGDSSNKSMERFRDGLNGLSPTEAGE